MGLLRLCVTVAPSVSRCNRILLKVVIYSTAKEMADYPFAGPLFLLLTSRFGVQSAGHGCTLGTQTIVLRLTTLFILCKRRQMRRIQGEKPIKGRSTFSKHRIDRSGLTQRPLVPRSRTTAEASTDVPLLCMFQTNKGKNR